MEIPEVNRSRRRFFGTAFSAVVATQFGTTASAHLPSGGQGAAALPNVRSGGNTSSGGGASFGPLKQVAAGVLDVGYVEVGPADGRAVILMHGWPYDIHSYAEVAPLLAAEGYRAIVPYFRGHGTTRFLSNDTFRNAQQSVFALDIVALMDALKIGKAILAGYDWGSRTGDIIAALWPERCKALVSVTGYLITDREANRLPSPPKSEWAWWYQYYFATERGVLGLTENRHDLAELIWKFNSPTWDFDRATFDRTAEAFNNPDYVGIVIDNYRWRLGLAKGDPRYDGLEKRLAEGPVISVPTITVDGAYDPFTPAGDGASYRRKFSGKYAHRTLKVGHNVPQEAPRAFAEAVVEADGL
ncbi:alpha/beta fold hydrolase [Kitasatospora sp. NPDC056138]|uniref:alpha/beta fold hydrolase n=1 Tax=Kitasatospora sp. NPDC056138 TaxID=3345724 RepID=UPI0035DEB2BB